MNWGQFQNGLYNYYVEHTDNPKSKEEFLNDVKEYKDRPDKYVVYYGYSRKDPEHKKVIYVGTTIQYPMSRWYYHSTHGKNFDFVEAFRFDNEKEMLDKEFELIKQLHPMHNKIQHRPQNYNVILSREVLDSRKGDPQWCQCCLKRHVNKGYKYCYFCSTLK